MLKIWVLGHPSEIDDKKFLNFAMMVEGRGASFENSAIFWKNINLGISMGLIRDQVPFSSF